MGREGPLTDGTIVMELAMDGIRKQHAGFYRGYLADDRSLIPLTMLLATGVAVWLLFYLVSTVGPAPKTPSALAPPVRATSSIFESRNARARPDQRHPPKFAAAPIPPVRRADPEGQLRVDTANRISMVRPPPPANRVFTATRRRDL